MSLCCLLSLNEIIVSLKEASAELPLQRKRGMKHEDSVDLGCLNSWYP